MKEFWKDYAAMCKDGLGFYKKHWKGCVVLNAMVIGAELAWFYKDSIKDKIDEKIEEVKKGQA